MPIVSCRSSACAIDELGADAVGGAGQHRLRVAGEVELEQTGEPAEAAEDLGAVGALDRRLHQLDGTVARRDVDAGGGVGRSRAGERVFGREATAACSGSRPFCTDFSMPSSTCLPTISGSGIGYSPSKQARHSRVLGCSVAAIRPSSET